MYYIYIFTLISLITYLIFKTATKLTPLYTLPVSIFIGNISAGIATIIRLGYLDSFFIISGFYTAIIPVFAVITLDILYILFSKNKPKSYREQFLLYLKSSFFVVLMYIAIFLLSAVPTILSFSFYLLFPDN